MTVAHVLKRKYEEKLLFEQLNNPKTLKKDKLQIDEKLKTVSLAIELAK